MKGSKTNDVVVLMIIYSSFSPSPSKLCCSLGVHVIMVIFVKVIEWFSESTTLNADFFFFHIMSFSIQISFLLFSC